MKLSIAFILFFLVTEAKAFNEVECRGRIENKKIRFEIERPFPEHSFYKDAKLSITEEGNSTWYDFKVTTQVIGLSRVLYRGNDVQLEIDFWPDQGPQWGRIYRGNLKSSYLGDRAVRNLSCNFM